MSKFCLIEEWRPIAGFEGRYEVSSFGRVRSFFRGVRLLQPGIASNGYPTVCLGRGNTRTVHSLVAETFIGPCPPNCEVRHKDGCRTNPYKDNLEYGTRSANIFDAVRHGTWVRGPVLKKAWNTRRQRYGAKGVRQCVSV